MIFLSFKEMIGGSFKSELYKIPFFLVDTEGWYCVTNGNISFSSMLFCFRSLDSLSVNFISGSKFSIKFCGESVHQAFFEI